MEARSWGESCVCVGVREISRAGGGRLKNVSFFSSFFFLGPSWGSLDLEIRVPDFCVNVL